jgi:hypothetical protein
MNTWLKHRIPFLLLAIILMTSCNSKSSVQTVSADTIIPDGKLRWEYYKGQGDSTSKYWAATYWYVKYEYSIRPSYGDTAKTDLQVWPVLKGNTWVLPDRKSDELLRHEQGHYNFAILLASEFKHTIDSTVLFKTNYSQKMDSIFQAIFNKYRQMEVQYDNETNHMNNKGKQELWNKKFEEMLKTTQ